jgi:hypothetical protein
MLRRVRERVSTTEIFVPRPKPLPAKQVSQEGTTNSRDYENGEISFSIWRLQYIVAGGRIS